MNQMRLPLEHDGLPSSRLTKPRASYHLNRDVPAHLAGNPGEKKPTLPTPTENGVFMRQHEVGAERDTLPGNHPAERTNYPNVPGQQVMGPPHNPAQFGELDRHGNVYHAGTKREVGFVFEKHGPFNSPVHEEWWQKHSKPQDVSTSAAVHTMQHPDETGSHAYIAGPIAKGSMTPTSILIHRGIPWVADGHHRMQEARGRGDATFPARVINLDQLHEGTPVVDKIGKKAPRPEVLDHLVRDHQVPARHVEDLYPEHVAGHARLHQGEPDDHFHGARNHGPSYGGLGAPAPKQGFTDNMNPAQTAWKTPPPRNAAKKAASPNTPVI